VLHFQKFRVFCLTTVPSDTMRGFSGIEQTHAMKAQSEIPLHLPFDAWVDAPGSLRNATG
jgi:hypothetical protein